MRTFPLSQTMPSYPQ